MSGNSYVLKNKRLTTGQSSDETLASWFKFLFPWFKFLFSIPLRLYSIISQYKRISTAAKTQNSR